MAEGGAAAAPDPAINLADDSSYATPVGGGPKPGDGGGGDGGSGGPGGGDGGGGSDNGGGPAPDTLPPYTPELGRGPPGGGAPPSPVPFRGFGSDNGAGPSGLSPAQKFAAGPSTTRPVNLPPGPPDSSPQQNLSAGVARWAQPLSVPVVQEPLGDEQMLEAPPPAIRYQPGYVQHPQPPPREMELWQQAMMQQQLRAHAPPAEVLQLEGPAAMDEDARNRKRAREEIARQFQAGGLDEHFADPPANPAHQQQLALHNAAVNALHANQAPQDEQMLVRQENALAIHERQANRHQAAAIVHAGIRPQVNAYNARAQGAQGAQGAYDLSDADRAQLAAMQREQHDRLFGGPEPVVVPGLAIEAPHAPAQPVAPALAIEAPPAPAPPVDRARANRAAAAAVKNAMKVARARR